MNIQFLAIPAAIIGGVISLIIYLNYLPVIGGTPYSWLYHHQTLLAGLGALLGAGAIVWRTIYIGEKTENERQKKFKGIAASILAELEFNLRSCVHYVNQPKEIHDIVRDREGTPLNKRHIYESHFFEEFLHEVGRFGPQCALATVSAYYSLRELSQTMHDNSGLILTEWNVKTPGEIMPKFVKRRFKETGVQCAKAIVSLSNFADTKASETATKWAGTNETT